MRKREPRPGSLVTLTEPPWASTMARVMDSPMPAPRVSRLLESSARFHDEHASYGARHGDGRPYGATV